MFPNMQSSPQIPCSSPIINGLIKSQEIKNRLFCNHQRRKIMCCPIKFITSQFFAVKLEWSSIKGSNNYSSKQLNIQVFKIALLFEITLSKNPFVWRLVKISAMTMYLKSLVKVTQNSIITVFGNDFYDNDNGNMVSHTIVLQS